MATDSGGRAALATGGLAALLASACCLGPLVLVTAGISGAWIGNLALLAPYRPVFLAASFIAMFFAWRRIYRPTGHCAPGEACAAPAVRQIYRVLFWLVAALILVALVFPYVLPLLD